jgi:hypothetical protein
MHRVSRDTDPRRLRAANFGQQDGGMSNEGAGEEAGDGLSLEPSRAPAGER